MPNFGLTESNLHGYTHKDKHLNYYLFEVQTQQTCQIKAHSLLILNISFISSIHEDVTLSDKVLNENSKFLSEILMILVLKSVLEK